MISRFLFDHISIDFECKLLNLAVFPFLHLFKSTLIMLLLLAICIINILKQKTELSCKVYDQSSTESDKINMDIEKLCSR